MSSTYVVVATAAELPLISRIKGIEGYPVIITGVGAINAANALRALPRECSIINVGYAGSLDLHIGEVYKIGHCQLLHDVEYQEPHFILNGDVPCFSSTDFVTATKRSGCVFDMELAFICSLGFDNVVAYKVVSDHCNYQEYENNIQL